MKAHGHQTRDVVARIAFNDSQAPIRPQH